MTTPKPKKKAENISTAQIERIRRNLRFAILTMTSKVKDKDQFKKDVHGLKYKSSNTKKVFLSVPKRKQKTIIDKHYLEQLNELFNRNGKTKYKLEIVVSKPKVWIPILCGGLATTLAATGTAVYFALTPVMVTMTLNLNDGTIPGYPEEKIDEQGNIHYPVKKGSLVSELPKPVWSEESKLVFDHWTGLDGDNAPIPDDTVITVGMTLKAEPRPATTSATLYGGKTLLEITDQGDAEDENQWFMEIDGRTLTNPTWSIDDEAIAKGITISNMGYVSYKNVPAGTYSCTITGEAEGFEAEASISVVSTDAMCDVTFSNNSGDVDYREQTTTISVIKDFNGKPVDPSGVHSPTIFSKINPPTPFKEGFHLDHWSLTPGGAEISGTQTFTENTTIYPVMAQTINPYVDGDSYLSINTDKTGTVGTWQLLDTDGVTPLTGVSWAFDDYGVSGNVPACFSLGATTGVISITTIDPSRDVGNYTFDLVATYEGVEYPKTITVDIKMAQVQLTFTTNTPAFVKFTGQTVLDVDKGKTWNDIKALAPYAYWVDTKTVKWSGNYSTTSETGTPIADTTEINANLNLYPIQEDIAPIWSLGDGPTFLRGETTKEGKTTVPWHVYNQFLDTPIKGDSTWSFALSEEYSDYEDEITFDVDESGDYTDVYINWQFDTPDAYTFTFDLLINNAQTGLDEVKATSAPITLVVDQDTATIHLGTGTSSAYGGDIIYDSEIVNYELYTIQTFGDAKKILPNATIADHSEYIQDGWSLTDGGALIVDTTTIATIVGQSEEATIYPHFKLKTPEVEIAGADKLTFGADSEVTYGLSETLVTGYTISWTLDDPDDTGVAFTPGTGATTTINPLNATKHGVVKLKATIKDDQTTLKNLEKDITILAPWESSVGWDKACVSITSESNATSWFTVESWNSTAQTHEGTIELAPLTAGSTEYMPKAGFDYPVYVGTRVAYIDDGFLSGCTAFGTTGGSITFGAEQETYDLAPVSCVAIGDDFMSGCGAYNSALALPSTIRTIGDDFMHLCKTFTASLTLPTSLTEIGNGFLSGNTLEEQPTDWVTMAFNNDLVLPQTLKTIGDDFLHGCVSFNHALVIPNSVTNIGSDFLWRCSSFDQNLTISQYVEDVGTDFMFGCNAFVHVLTINTPYYNFAVDTESLSFATDADSPAWLTNGFKLGVTADEYALFLGRFGNLTKATDGYNRKIVRNS